MIYPETEYPEYHYTQRQALPPLLCHRLHRLINAICGSRNGRYVKSFVEATGATLLRPDLPASSCECYRRRPTHGSQLALCAAHHYHGCITDLDGATLDLETDHRRHAEIENAIRDLKYGVGLNHLPSGRFPANAAWLAVQVMAHNLARWKRASVWASRWRPPRPSDDVSSPWPGASPCFCPGIGPGETISTPAWSDCAPCHSHRDDTHGVCLSAGVPDPWPTPARLASACLLLQSYR